MDKTTEPRRPRVEPRHARSATDARAARRYTAMRELLAVRRLENEGDRQMRELTLRLRDFDAREARVVAQLRAAGFLRKHRPA
jgi:hypothetical protein